VDGNDVLVQLPLDDIVDSWQTLVSDTFPDSQPPVIFMGYPSCGGRFDHDHRKILYPLHGNQVLPGAAACARWRAKQPSGTFPFLDSGGYMGTAAAVRIALEEALEFARLGLDYICMSTLTVAGIKLGPSKLRVDKDAKIFYSLRPHDHGNFGNWTPELARELCGESYFDEHGLPPAHSVTGHPPAVLHFVGPSKWYFLKPCMKAFESRRRLELDSFQHGQAAQAGGFANDSGTFCYFQADPCPQCTQPGCMCESCSETSGHFAYYDVDRSELRTIPFAAVLQPMP